MDPVFSGVVAVVPLWFNSPVRSGEVNHDDTTSTTSEGEKETEGLPARRHLSRALPQTAWSLLMPSPASVV